MVSYRRKKQSQRSSTLVQGLIMQNSLTIGTLIAIIMLLIGFMGFQGIKGCKSDTSALDSLSAIAHREQNVMRDTIIKYDTVKSKAEIVYRTKHDTLWKAKPDTVDAMFNIVFPRDTLDSTEYITGYTQLRKAIDVKNKSDRDSIKESASTQQIKACTTTVTKIVNQIDTVKDTLKINSEKIGWMTIASGVIIGVVSLFVGHSIN